MSSLASSIDSGADSVAAEPDGIAAAALAAAPVIEGESRARALAAVERGLFGHADHESTESFGQASASTREPNDAAPGSTIGRYVVLEPIGQGGMGAVTRAYDPKLRREVALKRLVARPSTPEGAARLLREAQAMAQLSHPNVVGVHDVETIGDEVVLVMEYVRGRTLRRWLSDARAWPDVLAAFRRAGAGLAAAHRVGIVHRDFKPSNVLVASDATVKVTDFGLAKATAGSEPASGDDISEDTWADELAAPLTRADAVVGTPRYMAPEQHAGASDAAADQFAFCVALWEALCGTAPFHGSSLGGLARAKHQGPPAWTGPRMPASVIAALRVGLAPDPRARFVDIDALLHALDPPSRVRLGLGMAAGALLVLGSAAAVLASGDEDEPPCTDALQRLEGIWDDARRVQVDEAFARTAAVYAGAAAERAVGSLDRWAHDWAGAHREACEATVVRAEQSAELLDLRMACLYAARRELDITARMLASADVELVDNVVHLVDGLPSIERCADADALRAEVPPPHDTNVAQAVNDARDGLAGARAQRRAGRFDRAQAIVAAWEPAIAALAYAPLQAELELERGRVHESLGEYSAAEPALREAMRQALEVGAWSVAAAAATTLAIDVGYSQRRADDGRWLADLAVGLAEGVGHERELLESALDAAARVAEANGEYARAEPAARRALALRRARLGEDDPRVAAAEVTLGLILDRRGHFAEADALVRHALWIRERALGAEHPEVAATTNVLGSIELSRGNFAEAEALYVAAIDRWAPTLGADHLLVAHATANLGLALHHQGRLREAEVQHRRALARRESILGADHPATLGSLNNLGLTLQGLQRLDEAHTVLHRVVAARTEQLGVDHLETVSATNNLGIVQLAMGHALAAEASFRHAATVWEHRLGADHPYVGNGYNNLGMALSEQRRTKEAAAAYRRAVGVWEAIEPADHVSLGRALHNLGSCLMTTGDVDEARPLLERAWEIRSRAEGDASLRTDTALLLAEAVEAQDPARAKALRERAR